MKTTAFESTSVDDPKAPTFTFQTSEQWHRSLPAMQKLQLTSHNLRDLGASLKTLNMLGQTPRASPSPSDSSSDSDSNHRIHSSTRKVCLREDMNMTRAISPRPSRPAAIVISDQVMTSVASWTKPDTPAPWRNPAQGGLHESDSDAITLDVITGSQNAFGVSIQLNGLSLSNVFPYVQRERRTAKSAALGYSSGDIPDSRQFRSRCGNGVGIRRRSHFALPRPQSLSKPRLSLHKGKYGLPAVIPFMEFMTSVSTACKTDGTAKSMLDSLSAGSTSNPASSSQPGSIAERASSDRVKQLSTYVDHVREQRLPSKAVQSTTPTMREQAEIGSAQQRRMSV